MTAPPDLEVREGALDLDASADRRVERLKSVAGVVAVLAILVRVVVHAAEPLGNADTWFHLRLGDEFWGHWSLRDPGSTSTFATAHWLPTQWSTEMLMSRIDHWFGLPGVAWMFGVIYVVFVLLAYRMCRREADALIAALTAGLIIIAGSGELSARPQVISLILLVVTVGAWRATMHDLRARWWLIPLTWAWATAHGLWTSGLLVGVVCVVGLLLDHPDERRRVLRLGWVPLGSLVAAMVTPVGPALLHTQLAVGARSVMISEWQPTSFRTLPAFVAAVMVGLLLMLWARSGRVEWTAILLVGLAAGWILLVSRMVGFGVIVVAPLFAAELKALLPARRVAVGPRMENRVIAAGACLLLAILAVVVPHTTKVGDEPTGFSNRLAALPARSVVFADLPVGSWLTWSFPQLDPVVDGMLDAYPVHYLQSMANTLSVEPGWKRFVTHSGAKVAILPKGTPLAAAIQSQLGWHKAATDGKWVYLTAGP